MLGKLHVLLAISCYDYTTLRRNKVDKIDVACRYLNTLLSDLQYQNMFVSFIGSVCYLYSKTPREREREKGVSTGIFK